MGKIWEEYINSELDLLKLLYNDKDWGKIKPTILTQIAKSLFENCYNQPDYTESFQTNNPFTCDIILKIREFLFVSKEYKMIKNCYIKIINDPSYSSETLMSRFAITLLHQAETIKSYCLLSNKKKNIDYINLLFKHIRLIYFSSVLCDEFSMHGYLGAVQISNVLDDGESSKIWKGAYISAKSKLENIDNNLLNELQKSAKNKLTILDESCLQALPKGKNYLPI